MKIDMEKAGRFIHRNARPLDLARWKLSFENGGRDEVLAALTAYRNEDGGFGHALEPDCWNPHSSPIQTWAATEILRELRPEDGEHPIIRGILRYLAGGADFDGHVWANTVPANNDFPHAPWWSRAADAQPSYNPTASLAGFIVRYARRDDGVYALGRRLAKEAYDHFQADYPLEAMHTVACYVELYEYLQEAQADDVVDLPAFRALLERQIKAVVTYDLRKWPTQYVCRPSLFIRSRGSDFYPVLRELADAECRFIAESQRADGTWDLTWAWGAYPEAWSVAANWWKGDLVVKYARFAAEFGGEA